MRRHFLLLLLLVLVIKFFFVALDSQPSFQFGDSASYLATASAHWIPPDRSFLYGFLIGPFTIRPRSLLPLVIVQVLLSGMASWMVGLCLVLYFETRFWLAAVLSIACALEPVQLMLERFVMTETMAICGMAVFFFVSFHYLKTRRLLLLGLAQVIAVILFSLRFSFLPLALVASVAVPLLAYWPRRNETPALRSAIAGLIVSLAVSQFSLLAYRHLYGRLAHEPPEYTSRDGLFLAADMAPIIRPVDYPVAAQRQAVFGNLTIPLSDPDQRRGQRWLPGGLCEAIRHVAAGNDDEANRLARKTAYHAMRRNPLGVLKLGVFTFAEFFNSNKVNRNSYLEQEVGPGPGTQEMMKRLFDVDVSKRDFDSLTKRWAKHSAPWCAAVVVLPLIYLVFIALRWRRILASELFSGICGLVLLAATVIPVEMPDPRYAIELAWFAFLIIGSILSAFAPLNSTADGRPEPHSSTFS